MKKNVLGFIGLVFTAAIVNAAMIDKDSVEIKFEGFKTQQMVGLEGKFNDVKYVFGNDNTSIMSVLRGASAVIKVSSLDTGVDEANKNLIGVFFQTLIGNKNDINVTFRDVIEGDNVGVIMANINVGTKKGTMLPLTYIIKDGKLEAKGQLNLLVFKNAKKALTALSKVALGHAGISWPLVNVIFTADITK